LLGVRSPEELTPHAETMLLAAAIVDMGGWWCDACGRVRFESYCGGCGAPRNRSRLRACPRCDHHTPERFCPRCGARVVDRVVEQLEAGTLDVRGLTQQARAHLDVVRRFLERHPEYARRAGVTHG
jgi:hypothetical protein